MKMLWWKCYKIRQDEIKNDNIKDSVDEAHIIENMMEIRLICLGMWRKDLRSCNKEGYKMKLKMTILKIVLIKHV